MNFALFCGLFKNSKYRSRRTGIMNALIVASSWFIECGCLIAESKASQTGFGHTAESRQNRRLPTRRDFQRVARPRNPEQTSANRSVRQKLLEFLRITASPFRRFPLCAVAFPASPREYAALRRKH